MKFHHHDVHYYVDRLRRKDHFAFVGYSDAEWFCILHVNIGVRTAQGQLLDVVAGDKLLDIIRRRHKDPHFLFAVPECMWTRGDFNTTGISQQIEATLREENIEGLEFYERDLVLDELAERAGLSPWIKQLQGMRTTMIGNRYLSELDFLNVNHFISTPLTDLHLDFGQIKKISAQALQYRRSEVVLVSAGISSAILIDRMYGTRPDCFYIDCGSIWDAFVGIGGQREWRRKLYKDPEAHRRWLDANLQP